MKLPSWIFYGFVLLQGFFLSAFALAEDNVQKIQIEQPSSISDLPSSNDASTLTGNVNLPVRACDYCNFLNEEVASDPDFLYDPKMESDAEGACIKRLGTPGNFHYKVIEGRENEPIDFVDEESKAAYCKWNQSKQQDAHSLKPIAYSLDDDSFLKSNQNGFEVVVLPSSTLSLAPSSISDLQFSNHVNSRWAEAFGMVGMFCLAGVGHEMMMRPGDGLDETEQREAPPQRQAVARASSASIDAKPGIADDLLAGILREPASMTAHYQEADRLWNDVQNEWDILSLAQVEAKTAGDLYKYAQVRHDNFLEKQANKEKNKNITEMAAQVMHSVKNVLVLTPFTAPFASFASITGHSLDAINKFQRQWETRGAQNALDTATRRKKEAYQKVTESSQKVVELERRAKEAEEAARAAMMMYAKADAKRIKPPSTSLNREAWKDWARNTIEVKQDDLRKVLQMAEEGKHDPSWAAEEAANAWIRRMEYSQQSIKNYTAQREHAIQLSSQEEKKFAEEREVKGKLIAEREKFKQLEKIHAEAKSDLDKIYEELSLLQNELDRPGRQDAIEKKRSQLSGAIESVENAFKGLEKEEPKLKELYQAAVEADREVTPIYQKQIFIKKIFERIIERLQARVTADKTVWKLMWPECHSVLVNISPSKEALATSLREGKQADLPAIEQPLIYDADAEEAGRIFFKNANAIDSEINQENSFPMEVGVALQQDKKESITQAAKGKEREEVTFIFSEPAVPKTILEPIKADLLRWDARRKADQLINNAVANNEGNQLGDDEKSEMGDSLERSIRRSTTVTETASQMSVTIFGSFPSKNIKDSNVDWEEEWEKLMREADRARITYQRVCFENEEKMIQAWKDADRAARAEYKMRRRSEKKKALNARVEKDWSSNKERWYILQKADNLIEEATSAKSDYLGYQEKVDFITGGNDVYVNGQKLSFDEAKQNRDKAQRHWHEAQQKADQAKREWSLLAEQYIRTPRVPAFSSAAMNNALAKLEEEDRAVCQRLNNLGVSLQYMKNKTGGISDIMDDSSDCEEAENSPEALIYQGNLLLEKQNNLRKFFEGVDAKRADAQKTYRTPSLRENSKFTYALADLDEEQAIQKYAKIAETDALKAARDKAPGAEKAWNARINQSIEAARAAKQRIGRTAEFWSDDAEREMMRYKAIARADVKALRALQKEAARLNDIETFFRIDCEAQEQLAKAAREYAAKEYHDGRHAAWYALSEAERKTYNRDVLAANDIYYRRASVTLEMAQEKFDQLQRELEKLQGPMDWMRGDEIKVISKKLFRVRDDLENKRNEEAQREKLIRAGRLTLPQREMALLAERTKLEAGNTWHIAPEKQTKEAWDEAATACLAAQNAWYNLPDEIMTVITIPDKVELSSAHWGAKALFAKAKWAEQEADVAKKKADDLGIHHTDFDTAWNEAIEKTRTASFAWNHVVQAYTKMPLSEQQGIGNAGLAEATRKKREYQDLVVDLQAQKSAASSKPAPNQPISSYMRTAQAENKRDAENRTIALKKIKAAKTAIKTADEACAQAVIAGSIEAAPSWNTANKKRKEAADASESVLQYIRKTCRAIPTSRVDLKEWWREQIEIAQDLKSKQEARIFEHLANESIAVANRVARAKPPASDQEKQYFYANIIEKRRSAKGACEQAVNAFRQGLKLAPIRSRAWWQTSLKAAEESLKEQETEIKANLVLSNAFHKKAAASLTKPTNPRKNEPSKGAASVQSASYKNETADLQQQQATQLVDRAKAQKELSAAITNKVYEVQAAERAALIAKEVLLKCYPKKTLYFKVLLKETFRATELTYLRRSEMLLLNEQYQKLKSNFSAQKQGQLNRQIAQASCSSDSYSSDIELKNIADQIVQKMRINSRRDYKEKADIYRMLQEAWEDLLVSKQAMKESQKPVDPKLVDQINRVCAQVNDCKSRAAEAYESSKLFSDRTKFIALGMFGFATAIILTGDKPNLKNTFSDLEQQLLFIESKIKACGPAIENVFTALKEKIAFAASKLDPYLNAAWNKILQEEKAFQASWNRGRRAAMGEEG